MGSGRTPFSWAGAVCSRQVGAPLGGDLGESSDEGRRLIPGWGYGGSREGEEKTQPERTNPNWNKEPLSKS